MTTSSDHHPGEIDDRRSLPLQRAPILGEDVSDAAEGPDDFDEATQWNDDGGSWWGADEVAPSQRPADHPRSTDAPRVG